MKKYKRCCAWLLAAALLISLIPTVQPVQAAGQETVLTEKDYREVDSLYAQLDAMEIKLTKKNSSQKQLSDAAAELVEQSENYVEDSLQRNGDSFTWWTDEGVRCLYSPKMRQIQENITAVDAAQNRTVNEPTLKKGGSATGNQVYLIGPYYGHDKDFTDQYKNEANRIATVIGDTDGYTLYSGTAATVDKVAEAVGNGAVVIFDSHGITDYENGYDFVTGATNSYLCLTSTTGLTTEDYNDGALYYSDGICINGATIANHMTKRSPGGLVWMAICLGMATNTMCEPLRQMGVEVVYGYSQSVTFAGDYLFEETFWEQMFKGNTVAQSVATMKATWGNWDWSTKIANYYYEYNGYATISAARNDYTAFPVVVSDEDAHPGQRSRYSYGACSLQDVKSTYTLNVVAEPPESPKDPTLTYVDTPEAGVPYKFVMEQANLGKVLGFAGEMNGYYYATTEEIGEMTDVYLEEVSGGYRMYFLDGSTKVYLNVIPRPNDPTKTNVVLETILENSAPSVYTLHKSLYYVKTSAAGAEWFLGTYSTHSNISASKISYIADTSTIGVSQFVAWFATEDAQQTPDTPVEPDVPDTPVEPELPDVPTGSGATITFDDTDKRTEISDAVQVWKENGITVSNHREGSESAVNGAYYDPIRLYKLSTLVVEYPGMVKLEAECCNLNYASAFASSVKDLYEPNVASVTTDGSVVIVTFVNAVDAFKVTMTRSQVRMSQIKVYTLQEEEPQVLPGDLDGNESVDEIDVLKLLKYILMPEMFQINQSGDFDGTGTVDEGDALRLLKHILLPDVYPLNNPK